MFTWICPKCGGEVLPSQDECPRCVRADAPQAPVQTAPAPAPTPVQAAPQPAPVAAAPVQPVYAPPAAAAPAPAPVHAAPAPSYYLPPEEPRSTTLRDTLVTLGVAVALLGGGYLYWNRGEGGAKKADKAAVEMEDAKGKKRVSPLTKVIEVTGIRLRTPKPGQAEISVLVVNHSAADISDLTIDVVLGAKGTNKEVAAFPITVKRLSPFGSAEVVAKTKTEVSAIDLPDWQFVEPKFVIQDN